ncbi:MAG: hypothetical protein R6W77_08110 [Trueperaceae bacterium]
MSGAATGATNQATNQAANQTANDADVFERAVAELERLRRVRR